MGSSLQLKEDIVNMGIDNFSKEILFRCSSEEEMERLEEEIVNREFLMGNVYNKMPGGKYGSAERNGLSFLGQNHSPEAKARIGKHSKGRTHSPQSRDKMSRNNFARRDPEKQKEHARRAGSMGGKAKLGVKVKRYSLLPNPYTGEKSPNFGLKREKVCCPHCGKIGANNTMSRWHFDNCKSKSSS